MSKKERKALAELRQHTKTLLDSLTREFDITDYGTKTLSDLWQNKLLEFANTVVHNQIMSYQRSLIRQMEFKDKLIEKLQNEFDEFRKHRNRASQNNLELVDDTLNLFKKEIEEIHDQYQIEVMGALPDNSSERIVRINENDNFWKILKCDSKAIDVQTHKKNTEIKQKYFRKTDVEKRRIELIMENFRDMFNYKIMKETYISVVDEYKKKTESLRANYKKFLEQDENLITTTKQINTRINDLTNKIDDFERKINEPELVTGEDALTKERDELQQTLNKLIKKVETHIACGQRQLSLLCAVTKPIETEVKNVLDKGGELMKCIRMCQKLETPDDANVFPENGDVQQPEHDAILGISSNFFGRLCAVQQRSKSIDADNAILQLENEELKKKISAHVSCLKTKKNTDN